MSQCLEDVCGGSFFCFCGDWCVSWCSVMLYVAIVSCRIGVSRIYNGVCGSGGHVG